MVLMVTADSSMLHGQRPHTNPHTNILPTATCNMLLSMQAPIMAIVLPVRAPSKHHDLCLCADESTVSYPNGRHAFVLLLNCVKANYVTSTECALCFRVSDLPNCCV